MSIRVKRLLDSGGVSYKFAVVSLGRVRSESGRGESQCRSVEFRTKVKKWRKPKVLLRMNH
jgi:hypothetical protein